MHWVLRGSGECENNLVVTFTVHKLFGYTISNIEQNILTRKANKYLLRQINYNKEVFKHYKSALPTHFMSEPFI